MAFGDDFDSLFPHYLVDSDKQRLRSALNQFMPEHRGGNIDYTDFYKGYHNNYFLQSDIVKEIRFPHWDIANSEYAKAYTEAIIVSNTCDISSENPRDVNIKQCLFAPIIDFKEYLIDLRASGLGESKIVAFSKNVQAQLYSNIFYLPPHFKEKVEYIALLDKIFWFPVGELNTYIASINDDRITSLSHYGFYLFLLKLSYHLCRMPEQCDREINQNL